MSDEVILVILKDLCYTIAIIYKQGYSPEEMGGVLPLTLAQVYAVLTCYHLRTEAIEADILGNSEDALIEAYGSSIDDEPDPSLS